MNDPETHAHIGCEEYYDEKPDFTKSALDELNEEVNFDDYVLSEDEEREYITLGI